MSISATTAVTTQVNDNSKYPPYAYTSTESHRYPFTSHKIPPLFDGPTTLHNFASRLDWLRLIYFTSSPILSIYLAFKTELQSKTLYWAIIYYLIGMFGITTGYHRYWTHRSFECTLPTQIALCLAGSSTFQLSIYWWSYNHRAHHRWIDSDKDPYNSTRGLFYSHLGWLFLNRPKDKVGYADIADLESDPLVRFQHKYYFYIATFLCFIFPTLVAGFLWDDWKGGFVFAGLCRLIFLYHATFCVNSLAHYIGDAPYDDYHSPKDSLVVAIATCGEGYHNFHHEFPQDYRNAILWYQYDPTKWLIKGLSFIGQTYNLKTCSENEIQKSKAQIMERRASDIKQTLSFGKSLAELPVYSLDEFHAKVNTENKKWILLDGIMYDVENFDHPGGMQYLDRGIGKDMTHNFNGGIYNHSNAARNLLTSMRVGVLDTTYNFSRIEASQEKCK